MKTRFFLFIAIISLAIFTISCGSVPEKKLIGTWKVENVQTDFNEQQVTPEMLAQIVEMQEQTYFRFMDDSVMVIISNNNTHEAGWSYSEEDSTIWYFFEGSESTPNELGKFDGERIILETNNEIGKILTYFRKEE